MQSVEHLQNLLDNISTCSVEKLPDFIYAYAKCPAAEQAILLRMMSFLRAPSGDLRMVVREVRQSGQFTMIVAHLPWPHGGRSRWITANYSLGRNWP